MAILSNLKINGKTISSIAKPTDINVNDVKYHLARYVSCENNVSFENSVDEPIKVNVANGFHSRNIVGSHYTFYGSSEVVKSENLYNPNGESTNENGAERYGVVLPSGTYTIINNSNSSLYYRDGVSSTTTNNVSSGVTKTITFTNNAVFWNSAILSNVCVREGTNTTYTPYFEPYIKNKGVKNLYSAKVVVDSSGKTTTNGITAYNNDNGSIHFEGTATASAWIGCQYTNDTILQIKEYTVAMYGNNIPSGFYFASYETSGGGTVKNATTPTMSFTTTQKITRLYFRINSGVTINTDVFFSVTNTSTAPSQYIPSDNHYYIPFNNTLLDIGTEPLRQGDTYSTDGVRKTKVESESIVNNAISQTLLSTPTTSVCQAYEFESGLSGSNLLRIEDVAETTVNGITYSIKNGIVTLNGTATANVNITLNSIDFVSNEDYSLADFTSNSNYGRYTLQCPTYNEWGSNKYTINGSVTFNATTSVTKSILLVVYNNYTCNNITLKPMLVKGSVIPTTYTTFIANETDRYSLSYGKIDSITCNGSSVTNVNLLNNGSITDSVVYNEYGIVNAWELNYTFDSTYKRFCSTTTINVDNKSGARLVDCISNFLETKTNGEEISNSWNNVAYFGSLADKRLFIHNTTFTDVTLFKQYLQANNVKIIYKLASASSSNISLNTPTSDTSKIVVVANVNARLQYAMQLYKETPLETQLNGNILSFLSQDINYIKGE